MNTVLMFLGTLALAGPAAAAFDHEYAAWDAVATQHVHWLADGKQSRVDYAALKAQPAALRSVLATFSAVSQSAFDSWSQPQQMAFLVNAYNAFTIELILTRYPALKSIRDLGTLLTSPWKKPFFMLLGAERSLDWIEHEQLRAKYAEPRVHAAVNCASIGCPALRSEAFTATKLDGQLDDGMRRFLGDSTRNRVRNGRLEVSPIFKWFRGDFEKRHQGFTRLEDVFARYAPQLTDDPVVQAALRARTVPIGFLEYDWSLNATTKP